MNGRAAPLPPSALADRVGQLVAAFEALNANPRAVAEGRFLLEQRNSFEQLLALIELLKDGHMRPTVQLLAAIELKNLIAENWDNFAKTLNGSPLLEYTRDSLLQIYLESNANRSTAFVKKSVVTVLRRDFPVEWPSAAKTLCGVFSETDHEMNKRVLELFAKITRKYEEESRSDPLYQEIIDVVDAVHDKLLFFAQGYILALQREGVEARLALENLRLALRVFYRLIFQDIHPRIEDNIANWAGVLRQVLAPTFASTTSLRALCFACRGEATRVSMFVATKYKQDFEAHIHAFIENVWRNCIELGGDEETFVASVRFIKSFATAEEYSPFFGQNIEALLRAVALPALLPDATEQSMFEEEPAAFTETLFAAPAAGQRRRHAVADLLSVLTRFHREKMLECLRARFAELQFDRSLATLPSELAFIDAFGLCVAPQYSPEYGASYAISPAALVVEVWRRLCEGFWADFIGAQSVAAADDLRAASFAVALQTRFAAVFRYFLDLPDLLIKSLEIYNSNRHSTLRMVILTFISRIITSKRFTLIDNLHIDDSQLSYFQRYYNSPKRLLVQREPNFDFFTFETQSELVTRVFESFLLAGRNEPDNSALLRAILILAKKAKGQIDILRAFLTPFIEMALELVSKGKLPLNGEIVCPLFELLGFVFTQNALVLHFLPLLQNLNVLFEGDIPEIASLAFQSATIALRASPDCVREPVFSSLMRVALNPARHTLERIGALPAEHLFISQTLSIVGNSAELPAFIAMGERLAQLRLPRQLFESLEVLILNGPLRLDALALIFAAGDALLSPSSSSPSPDAAMLALTSGRAFFRSLCLALATMGTCGTFEALTASGLAPTLRRTLTAPTLATAIATLGHPRAFEMLIMARTLFQDADAFERAGLRAEYAALLSATLENVWNRRYNAKALSGRGEEIRERDELDQLSGRTFSMAARLSELKNIGACFAEKFVETTQLSGAQIDGFLIEKCSEFATLRRIALSDLISDKKHLDLFNNSIK